MNRRNSDISAGSIFTVILAGIALFCVSSFLSHLLYGLFSGLFVFSDPFFRTASGYLCFIPYWIIVPAAIRFFRPFRSSSGKIILFGAKEIKQLFSGAFAGLILAGICVLIPYLDHSIVPESNPLFQPVFLPVFFLCVLVQAGAEELLFRAYLQRSLEACDVPCWGAVIIPAVLFAAAHITNSGISLLAIIVLFSSGLIYGLLFRRSGSFMAAAGMHAAWNFIQSILFGFPNSGVSSEYALFTVNDVRGKTLSYDPSFGIEASFTTLAVHVTVILLLLISARRNKSKKPVAKRNNQEY